MAQFSFFEDDSNAHIFKLKKNLVNLIQIIIKTSQLHDINNIALKEPLNNLIATISKLSRGCDEVTLQIAGDRIIINEEQLRTDIEIYSAYSLIIKEMKKREIGSIIFTNAITYEDMKKFFGAFNDPKITEGNPLETLTEFIESNAIGIFLIPPHKITKEFHVKSIDKKEMAKKTYSKTLSVVNEAMESMKVKQVLNVKKTKIVVQKMIDSIFNEESNLMGLTTIKSHDEYTYNHSVNVCILSLAIGQRLGYSKSQLKELGVAALFHDIGKNDVPLDILNKTTAFTPQEWHIMRQHPVYGVKDIIKLKGISRLSIKILVGAFEHHLNYDLSGYPVLKHKRDVSMHGRIISIVDCYDALTDSRVYNRIPFSPDNALKFMLKKTGQAFDPILMKIFVNTIGVYPIGSLVILNTHELGIVIATNPNPELNDKPQVQLLKGTTADITSTEILDLSEKEPSGANKWEIIKTVDPHKYGLDTSKLFLA